ncbi:MAG TPA: hypothetical protein VGL46_21570 [Pseudonocardiaceae bacterium]|jgi:hypothetical protein
MATTRQSLMVNAAFCDEQDAWTDESFVYGWLEPTAEDAQNVACYREMNAGSLGNAVGYVLH